MSGKCSWIPGILCLSVAALVCANCLDVESVLQNVPEDERADFLKYHLEKGYELVNQEAAQPTKDMKGLFSVELYKYMLEHHEVTDAEIKKLLREIICFDDGTCVDIGDVGIHPYSDTKPT